MNNLVIALADLGMEVITGIARLSASTIGEWAFAPALLVAAGLAFVAPLALLTALSSWLPRRQRGPGPQKGTGHDRVAGRLFLPRGEDRHRG